MLWFFLFSLVLMVLIWRHHCWRARPWPAAGVRPALYQAHRGYCKKGDRENTLASFAQARRQGFEMIELDVHLSKDGVPVVFHDEDLQRLGERSDRVAHLTAAQMKEWVGAPSLEEVLRSADVPSKINIEVKGQKLFNGRLEAEVCRVVGQCQAESRVMFSSFNPAILLKLRKYLPQVPRALLASREPAPGNRLYLRQLWLAPYLGVQALHLDYRYVSSADLQSFRRRQIPVAFWTVNDPGRARELLAAGALSVITDELLI